ncbi:energy-coupling factor transporter transmembrane protein EcfT [Vagococcus sp. PNs007]|uniref:Energy-coupling factor transporter transmembrane protein EcfT n=1 Tax=Vagococcus proximus TaxID=2991417 RepID=A0ABT5WZ63_9ENTE|nr:energy-coupling factor transporter transmembrane component T [Vagococcus proximus]MDF0479050.1 energy-coupling factor transporter transmembrane protein EcfT [Vagococcus proximus]
MPGLILDPRIKFFMIIIGNLAFLFHLSFTKQALLIGGLAFLLLIAKKYRTLFTTLSILLVLVTLYTLTSTSHEYFFASAVAAFSLGLIKLMPTMMAGIYLIKTTTVSELILSLEKLKIPKKLVIPLLIMIRFIPHFLSDAKSVYHSICLRLSSKPFFKRFSWEAFLIPLLNSAITSAEELTLAGLSKGLDRTNPRTQLQTLQFKTLDACVVIASLMLLIL